LNTYDRTTGKGYSFGDSECGIELKLNRIGSKNSVKKSLTGDVDKLRRLSEIERNRGIRFIVFYFDKRERLNENDLEGMDIFFPNVDIFFASPTDTYFYCTFAMAGEKWRMHQRDKDPRPSVFHAHGITDRGKKVDMVNGNIIDARNNGVVGKIDKNELKDKQEFLRKKGFRIQNVDGSVNNFAETPHV